MQCFNYADIEFHKEEGRGFVHNAGDDFACMALWKSARPYTEKIRKLLAKNFEILLDTEIEWSDRYFHQNAQRLYEAPLYVTGTQKELRSSHSEKIGANKFILIIVKDPHPSYTYARSVSGKIELSNLNIVKAKYKIRAWINRDTGQKYGVHSTNNIYEFFFQTPLLLGPEIFEKLLKGEKINAPYIKKDLEGAGGWESYKQVFRLLNMTTNYLVQRSFETLPFKNEECDIDILTDNYQRFASAIGASQHPQKPYKGKVLIEGKEISLDIRFVGDKYYDPVWAKKMLNRKVVKKGVYIPEQDDYFFSLFYHCKVQKPQVKKKYFGILKDLAEKLNFEWYTTESLNDNEASGKILQGFLQSEGYFYEDPIDRRVYKNKPVIRHLPTHDYKSYSKTQRLKARILRSLPVGIRKPLKKIWRRMR